MKKLCLAILLAMMCAGCATIAKQSLPTDDKEDVWPGQADA